MKNKKEYYLKCTQPFYYVEIFEDFLTICCPDWCRKSVVSTQNQSILSAWNSEKLQELRKQFLRGDYRACNSALCHKLQQSVEKEKVCDIQNPFPIHVKFSSDRRCNLMCRSCREGYNVEGTGQKIPLLTEEQVRSRWREMVEAFGPKTHVLEFCGDGDFSVSLGILRGLETLTLDFPKLTELIVHTNMVGVTPKLLENYSEFSKKITQLKVSVDAGNKEVYEKIRRGGRWEKLLGNLDYAVETLPALTKLNLIVVVQKDNIDYLGEIVEFWKNRYLGKIKERNIELVFDFFKLVRWGSVSEETFQEICISEQEEKEAGLQLGKIKLQFEEWPLLQIQTNLR